MSIKMSKEYQEYAASLENRLIELYDVAKKAREKGLDPAAVPEIDVCIVRYCDCAVYI